MWRIAIAPPRPRLHARGFRSAAVLLNAAPVPETSRPAAEETREIIALDKLLRLVRERSHPNTRFIVPMRTPGLYSQTLLEGRSQASDEPVPHVLVRGTQPEPPGPLPARAMHESYSEISLPLRSDPKLFEKFINAVGGIRTGKLMEHLDSLAGSIAYKHILGQDVQTIGRIEDRGLYVVTAAVDRLDMLQPLASWKAVADLRLSGNVIYTGRSSMEIAVKMEALHQDAEPLTVMIGRFSMVCRDALTHTARAVNALALFSSDEKQLFSIGEGHQKRKKAMSLMSLDRVPPSSEEAKVLHDYQLTHSPSKRGENGIEFVPMEDTRLQNCFMMFPQERNVHGKVFGGYLMRLAYELAYANSSLFARRPMRFLSLDDISFRQPVNIGSIVRLASLVSHTSSNDVYPAIIHVRVQADVLDIATSSAQTTNDFRFTWCADDGDPMTRAVVPRTYQEAMMWLEGRRALAMGDEIRGLRAS